MTKLTTEQAKQVQSTLKLARLGRATVLQMATAHELATDAALTGCSTELQHHMVQKLDPTRRYASRDLLLGMASGALTHYLLRGV